jgi:hypothetical protein
MTEYMFSFVNLHAFFKSYIILYPPKCMERSDRATSSPTFSIVLSHFNHSVSVHWYLIVVLVYIFMISGDNYVLFNMLVCEIVCYLLCVEGPFQTFSPLFSAFYCSNSQTYANENFIVIYIV